jgi:hypothetical protein
VSLPAEYFRSAEYLEGCKDPCREKYFDKALAQLIATICFPRILGGTVFDWGAASGHWLEAMYEIGYTGMGIDLAPPENANSNVCQADLRTFEAEWPVAEFAHCNGVLMYLNQPEALAFLWKFYNSFSVAGFLFTPQASEARHYDPNGVWFPDPLWLLAQCQKIGGLPMLLHLSSDPERETGPSILWLKQTGHWSRSSVMRMVLTEFRKAFETPGYPTDFFITL